MFYTNLMATVGVRELNQQTSQILDRVRAGETIEVTDRGVPIAEIRPVGREQSAIARLVAEGRLRPATIDPAVLHVLPKEPLDGVDVGARLAADREQERW